MRALLVIADIGGYTQFMKLHRMSVAHAQENTDRLLKAVIESAPRLKLANLEGDAAFFYVLEPEDETVAGTIAGLAAGMHHAFHDRRQQMAARSLCQCGGCVQLADLTVKVVAHIGEVVPQAANKRTTLAGFDVIVVHRLLKNSVPVNEYVLMTEPVLERIGPDVRGLASEIDEELEGIGTERLYFLDLREIAEQSPAPPPASTATRLGSSLGFTIRTLPRMLRVKR